eukprot:363014-Chlamydomonas_euryale.AAC.2
MCRAGFCGCIHTCSGSVIGHEVTNALRALLHWGSTLGSGGVDLRIGSTPFHWAWIERGVGRQHRTIGVRSVPQGAYSFGQRPSDRVVWDPGLDRRYSIGGRISVVPATITP